MSTRSWWSHTGLRRDAWAARHGLRPSDGRTCLRRLLGQRCMELTTWKPCVPHTLPHLAGDHETLWLRDRRPVLFLSQPYEWTEGMQEETTVFCARHGLALAVDPTASWWNSGVVGLLVWNPTVYTPSLCPAPDSPPRIDDAAWCAYWAEQAGPEALP